jgi:hypothetical protein
MQAHGLSGITTQWLSRTLHRGKIAYDTDVVLRPIVLQIEDLIKRFEMIPLSFDDTDHIKLLLELIKDDGLDVHASIRLPNGDTE